MERKTGMIICVILVIVTISSCTTTLIYSSKESNKACKEIGFEKYRHLEPMEYCQDEFGNLHYIELKCNSFLSLGDCTANEISVGDVRVTEVKRKQNETTLYKKRI